MSNLVQAATVFQINLPEWLEDSAKVGTIAGVAIYAGEVRRLSAALANNSEIDSDSHDSHILQLLRRRELIQAIKYRRDVAKEGLKQAKDYVEAIGVRNGLRKKDFSLCGEGMAWA